MESVSNHKPVRRHRIFHCTLPDSTHSHANTFRNLSLDLNSLLLFAGFDGECPPQPFHVSLLHYLGAAISFMCACFYTAILTVLTGKCALSGYEKVLYPLRIISTVIQVIVTVICILSQIMEPTLFFYFYCCCFLSHTHRPCGWLSTQVNSKLLMG